MSTSGFREGEELPGIELVPDLGQVIRFCALNWVFPPFFYDPEVARKMGMPGTIIPGPLKLGLMAAAAETWLDGAGFVRQVRAAHRRPDQTGKPIVITGRVARRYEEDDADRADLEMVIVNERGEPSVRGFATVQFTNGKGA